MLDCFGKGRLEARKLLNRRRRKMRREELVDVAVDIPSCAESVAARRKQVVLNADTCLLCGTCEQLALMGRHQVVLISMQDEQRRIIFRQVSNWVRRNHSIAMLAEQAADEASFRGAVGVRPFVLSGSIELEEICWPEEVDCALHTARLSRIAKVAFQRLNAT